VTVTTRTPQAAVQRACEVPSHVDVIRRAMTSREGCTHLCQGTAFVPIAVLATGRLRWTESHCDGTWLLRSCGHILHQMLSSMQVDKPASKAVTTPDGQRGDHWSIPMSVCKHARSGTDRNGNPCTVTDCTLHPDAVSKALADKRFMNITVEAALEQCASVLGVQLSQEFTLPKMKFKGTQDCPDTPCVTVRAPCTRGTLGRHCDGVLDSVASAGHCSWSA
jgi:hypothetical protein